MTARAHIHGGRSTGSRAHHGKACSPEEAEPVPPELQGQRISDEPMDADGPLVVARCDERYLLETGVAEPAADGRGEIGFLMVSRPDHLRVSSTQLSSGGDRRTHVVVADVAEDSTQKQQVRGYRIGVHVALSRVGLPDLDLCRQAGCGFPCAGSEPS